MTLSISCIGALYASMGGRMYSGEPVTQLEHALRGMFAEDVLEPIRWHVDAKRYLCRERPDYYASLSPDSKRSLVLQGGIFSPEEASAFAARRWAQDAVNLRLWDDLAKVAGERTPHWAHFEAILGRVASSN